MKKTFYLYKHGTLKRKDNSLCLVDKAGHVDYFPIQQIDCIVCFSEVTLNKRVLALLNKYQITILFLNYYGDYIGRFQPKKYIDGKILVQQVNAYQDEKQRLYIAKAITVGSIKNMRAVMKYYAKKGRILDRQIWLLDEVIEEIESVKSVEELLLQEAKAKQIYYSVFDGILENDEYKFVKRSKNPPLNEINAMMSYGYSMLYSILLSILDRNSLMPQISFIHSLTKNYDSLQYDLADIFKSVLVDRLIFRLIRKQQIKKEYFEYYPDGRCYMTKEGLAFFTVEFDNNLKITVKINNKSYSYRSLLTREVYNLANYIKGDKKQYKTFAMKW